MQGLYGESWERVGLGISDLGEMVSWERVEMICKLGKDWKLNRCGRLAGDSVNDSEAKFE